MASIFPVSFYCRIYWVQNVLFRRVRTGIVLLTIWTHLDVILILRRHSAQTVSGIGLYFSKKVRIQFSQNEKNLPNSNMLPWTVFIFPLALYPKSLNAHSMPFCCKIDRPAWRLTVFATCLASMLLESLHVHCHPLRVGPSFGGRFFSCWIRADWVGARKNWIFVEIYIPVNFHEQFLMKWHRLWAEPHIRAIKKTSLPFFWHPDENDSLLAVYTFQCKNRAHLESLHFIILIIIFVNVSFPRFCRTILFNQSHLIIITSILIGTSPLCCYVLSITLFLNCPVCW